MHTGLAGRRSRCERCACLETRPALWTDALAALPCPSTTPPPVQALALRDFMLPMLSFDPARRASAAEMLQHPWLAM